MATESQDRIWTVDTDPAAQDIDDVELHEYNGTAVAKFAIAFAVGAFFFLLPIPWQGEVTVPFDIAVDAITGNFPDAVGVYALGVIVAGGALTTLAELERRDYVSVGVDLTGFRSSTVFWALRVAGALIAPVMFLHLESFGRVAKSSRVQ